MNNERWLPIKGFECCYEVSDHGRVRSIPHPVATRWETMKVTKPRILRGGIDQKGYHRVSLVVNREYTTMKVHRLVACAFIEERSSDWQVNHKDGNKLNNHVSNLEWVTGLDNIRHARALGLFDNANPVGENNGAAILTDAQVTEIKQLIADKWLSFAEIGARYGVTKHIITRINTGKNWTHVGEYVYPIRTGRARKAA